MKVYPTPENEIERLRVLKESRYFSEKEYESITQLASYLWCSIALVSLIDQNSGLKLV
jgi:hypothetical protein